MTAGKGKPGPEILTILGERLTAGQLSEFFPDLSPSAVRNYLKEAARSLSHAAPSSRSSDKGLFSSQASARGRTKSGRLTLFTDGASRGNPGEAGAGIVLVDEHNQELYGSGTYLGLCTNNVAEYQALLLGLSEAKKHGGKNISIFLDSELIVRQLLGQYQVKDVKLKPLFEKVKVALSGFESYTVKHVPRAQNKRADQLANQGIDEHLRKG